MKNHKFLIYKILLDSPIASVAKVPPPFWDAEKVRTSMNDTLSQKSYWYNLLKKKIGLLESFFSFPLLTSENFYI